MLFNSYEFIFFLLPIALAGFFILARRSVELAILWLVLASLFFYGWWNPAYLALIVASMLANFVIGRQLSSLCERAYCRRAKLLLILAIGANLGLLAYYKYAGFFVENLNAIAGLDFNIGTIVLPLAISFFTFQQIAYLVDAYRGITSEYKFLHYALFVTFFPQLIAGPIVHHKEMLPQFMRSELLRPKLENISVGLTIFTIGLFKKTVLADGVAQYASPVFDAAAMGETLTFFEAWGGALAYTMQLYFDFSGYSDMAIGAARLFGIRLPLNFHSPYKATSIIEFWRRWHMTLSRFLRDYVYIPLGGNRRGKMRRHLNLIVTMLLGGLWHGAGWTFVVWGALHGVYLMINHAWHRVGTTAWGVRFFPRWLSGGFLPWLLTFAAIVVSWVFFRAADFDTAMSMLSAMAGGNGVELPNAIYVRLGFVSEILAGLGITSYLGGGSVFLMTYIWVAVTLFIALVLPNTQQFMARFDPALKVYDSSGGHEIPPLAGLRDRLRWSPVASFALLVGMLGALAVLALTSVTEFLYFQF